MGTYAALLGTDRLVERFRMPDLNGIVAKSAGLSGLVEAMARLDKVQTASTFSSILTENFSALTKLAGFESDADSMVSRYAHSAEAARKAVGLSDGLERICEDVKFAMNLGVVGPMADLGKSFEALAAGGASVVGDWTRDYFRDHRLLSGLATTNFDELLDVKDLQLASANAAVANIVAGIGSLSEYTKLMDGLTAYASVQSTLLAVETDDLLRGASFRPSHQLDAYLGTLGVRPTVRRADLAGVASFAVSGLMASEALMTPDLELDDLEALRADVDAGVTSPWRQGLVDFQTELYRELSCLNPEIPELLKGAWVDITDDGPAAVTKVATCLVEALDVTLRALCQGTDLLSWLMEQGLSGERYIAKGRPTRSARATFALRTQSRRDRQLVGAMEDGVARQLVALMAAAERAKHEPVVVSVAESRVRALAVSTESLLGQLLGM